MSDRAPALGSSAHPRCRWWKSPSRQTDFDFATVGQAFDGLARLGYDGGATNEARITCGKDPELNELLFALRRGAHLGLAAVLVLAMAACAPADDGGDGGADGDAGGGGTATVSGGTVEITADDIAFDAGVIEAPAGEAFTVTLVNNDSVPHNISFYVTEGGEEIAVGEVINGGETVEVEVPALDAGEYFFVCDVHPQQMTGSLVIEG